ncbi:MAG: cupredoxin family copper-binding protein [Acidobacteria bacterium]|nr:cupredoxin family copper-binding protein [Acidobacteriota bacterium]
MPVQLKVPGALVLAGIVMAFVTPSPAGPNPAGKTHTILIKGFRFVPEKVEVAVGDTVTWTNQDIVPHTATAKKVFDSKNLNQGGSWSFVAKQKGHFPYICTYHPTMTGELIVN